MSLHSLNVVKLPYIFWVVLLSTVNATQVVHTTRANGSRLDIIEWICPDSQLFEIVQGALQQYDSVDELTNDIRQNIYGYRNLLWSVNAVLYTRATADLMPTKRTTSRNLCFVSVTQDNLIVFVAAVVQ